MIRKISAIIVAYVIFAASAVVLFQLTGQKPHAEATISFKLVTAIYGALFSIISGIVLQFIAKANLSLNYILAVIIAGFATFSLFKSDGSHWTQLFAIIIFAPASILGGYFYLSNIAGKRHSH